MMMFKHFFASVLQLVTSKKKALIVVVACLASLFLSYDSSVRGAVINPDGICYLKSAEALATADLTTAMNLCGQAQWPFYSILIYGYAALTNVSYQAAAFSLNALFSLITVLTFLYIIHSIRPSQRLLWCAAGVILLAHEFNDVREYIIRDHGFWAFYLISIACLIRFFKSAKLSDAVLWSSATLVASLFRLEGIIFLLFLPFSVLVYCSLSLPQRVIRFVKLNGLVLSLSLVLIVWALFFNHQPINHFSRLAELQAHFIHGIDKLVTSFNAASKSLGQYVLSPYSARDSSMILVLMLVVWYVLSVCLNLSPIYAVLVVYAWVRKLATFDKSTQWVLWSYVFINLAITFVFLTENMFLAKRYLIALSLALMLWVPFALDHLIETRRRIKWLLPTTISLMVLTALGGIFDFGYSKAYVRDSGEWLAIHAPQSAKIYSNDLQVMYYSKHFGDDLFIQSNQFASIAQLNNQAWKNFDYIALHLYAKNKAQNVSITNAITLTPANVFANKRGDQVIIYQVKH
jgi:hypothetical protein